MNSVSVSVVIPAYNRAQWVGRAIRSVLMQTRPVAEILVVDDGSTDGTAEIAGTFGPPVEVMRQANQGAAAARNTGIQAAQGQWIAFLDADDQWLPDKMERQLRILRANPSLVWTTGNYYDCLCRAGRIAEHTPAGTIRKMLGGQEYFKSYFEAWIHALWGNTDVMLIRRNVLLEAGLFSTDLKLAEDLDLWLRIAYRYPAVGFSAEPLAVYHLEVGDRSMLRFQRESYHADFVSRHEQLAAAFGRTDDFRPCGRMMMKRWIRSLLFEARTDEIRVMLDHFEDYFSAGYRRRIRLLTKFPGLTAFSLHTLSKIIRTLRLRRKLTTAPPRPR